MEKKKIIIAVDNACDFVDGYAEKYNIPVMQVPTILGGKEFIKITNKEVFAYVKESNELPKTASPSNQEFNDFFSNLCEKYENVIYLSVSSAISSMFNNAKKEAEKFSNLVVLDTHSVSSGIALLVMNAMDDIQAGKSAEEVQKGIENNIPKIRVSFILDTLKYMVKGGRCSRLALFAASILGIKPTLIMKDKGLAIGKKYFKKIGAAAKLYVEDALKDSEAKQKKFAFITYTTLEPALIEELNILTKSGGFENVYNADSSATVSSHCGENCVGLMYLAE